MNSVMIKCLRFGLRSYTVSHRCTEGGDKGYALGRPLDELLRPTNVALVDQDMGELRLVQACNTSAVIGDELRELYEAAARPSARGDEEGERAGKEAYRFSTSASFFALTDMPFLRALLGESR